MSIRDFKTIEERRKYLARVTKTNLTNIGNYSDEFGMQASSHNCENMIGAISIPLGIAGPLKITGNQMEGEFWVPLATTEAALVASINRGCKAITKARGARSIVERAGVTRGPVFRTSGIEEGYRLKNWLASHFNILVQIASETSAHIQLLKYAYQFFGTNAYTRFIFDTSEAMGMNMVTYATDEICKYIEKETKIQCVSVAGNFDIDKKSAWLNFIHGRGRRVLSEVKLPQKVIREILHTSAQSIHEVAIRKCLLGSAISGSLGFNSHFANVVAAFYLALGQDGAHIGEGSLGITSTELNNNDLYMSVYLPDIMVGTVGGGIELPAQKEALSILGIGSHQSGEGADKLACVLGAAVLAGEISLLASLACGTLATAHRKLSGKKSR